MAQMFSTKNPPNPSAEHRVFEVLKKADHTMYWKVFYSFHVPNPGGRPREIDFLVIIPEYFSIICLEVKGGSYDLRDGSWYAPYTHEPLPESPHDEARERMFALKNGIEQQGYKIFRYGELSIGCAVAFKDVEKPASGLPTHLAFSIWSDDVQDPNRLCSKLRKIAEATSSSRRPKTADQLRNAKQYLIDLQMNLEPRDMSLTKRIFSSDLATLREELLVLTNDQLHSLDLIKDNDCCVIDGTAGTGKTVLAMELASQRSKENGEKIALICSNSYLSKRFVRWTKTLSNHSDGTVVAGTLEDFSTFDSQKQEKFDYLIVDEAQNLCDEKSRSLMEPVLEGGLTNGYWTMFGDFAHQNIINPDLIKNGEEVLNRLKELYPRMTLSRLKINCRNTYEIAAAVSMLVDIETLPRSGVHGPLIQIKYFDSDSPEHLDNLLDHLVSDLKYRKFFSRQIILLSSSSDDFNTVPPRKYGGWGLLNVQEVTGEKDLDREDVPDVSGDSSPKTLRYSNIYDFQGLESEVVILVLPLTEKQTKVGEDATLPNYEHLQRVLYTGMSRAKAILVIVADKSYKEHLDLEPRFEPTYKEFIESIAQNVLKSNTV